MPALEAGRCAQYQGGDPFKQFHFAVFRAYFEENRDISSRKVLTEIGENAGLDAMHLEEDLERGQARVELEAERRILMAKGTFTGVPTVFFGTSHPFVGAMPVQVYQRAIERIGR
jgi:predicted DsbA family dithiol-disulfide isomerase